MIFNIKSISNFLIFAFFLTSFFLFAWLAMSISSESNTPPTSKTAYAFWSEKQIFFNLPVVLNFFGAVLTGYLLYKK